MDSCSSNDGEQFPFSISTVEEDFNAKAGDSSTKFPWGLVHVGPNAWVLPAQYQHFATDLHNFPVTPQQAWVIGFPRSGTSMMQELVWLIHNNVDFEGAKMLTVNRVKGFDNCYVSYIYSNEQVKRTDFNNSATSLEEKQNVIRTHQAFDILPPKLLETCKVVFIARNPKDVAVSNFKFCSPTDNFEIYWKQFEEDMVMYGPFLKYVLQGWEKRNHPNVLFLFYEDTQRDMRGTIIKVAKHLGKSLTKDQIDALESHINIKSFKQNTAVNLEFTKALGISKGDFVWRGGVGGWREYFSEEMKATADAWIVKNTEGTDFKFPEH